MRTLLAMAVLVSFPAAAGEDSTYWSRFEVMAWSDSVLAVREVYDVSEAGGGRASADCKYPGMKQPAAGAKLHFVRYALGVPLALKEAVKQPDTKTFVIYESTFEAKRCTQAETSKARLKAAKAHAAAAMISLETKPKVLLLRKTEQFATDCFLVKPAPSCSGAMNAPALTLRYHMVSATVAARGGGACPVGEGTVEHGCAVSLRVDVEAGFEDNVWSVSAAHAGEIGSGRFDFVGFEGYSASEAASRWVLKLNFRDRFLAVAWERPVVVVLSTIG